MKKALILFADGMEECEGLIVVDLLRRAHVEVDIVSITDQEVITSSHGIRLYCDTLIDHVDFSQYDMLILPGGMPGTTNLKENNVVREQIRQFNESGRKVAAICAAPSVFADVGILEGKRATVHPNFRDDMQGAELVNEEVVIDGNITTSWGLGGAIPFGLELARQLTDADTVNKIRSAIGYIH